MKKTVQAYNPFEMAYHKFMLKQVIILIITGLPFFSKSFSFIAYAIGYPLSILLNNSEVMATGMSVLRFMHWVSGFLLTAASIVFLVLMIIKLKNLSILPDRWGFSSIIDGIKQMKLHYVDGKKANFGKMNIGQKASAWLMVLAMGLLIVSGISLVIYNLEPLLIVKSTASLLRDIHSYSFLALGFTVVIHVFFALLPSNSNAFKAMFHTGKMDLEYVKEHHPLWYNKLSKNNSL